MILQREPDFDELMAASRIYALKVWPYIADTLWGTGVHVSDKVVDGAGNPTMGVTDRAVLMIHPEAPMKWAKEPFEEGMTGGEAVLEGTRRVATVLTHEDMHIALRHPQRIRRMDPMGDYPQEANQAADCVVNHMMRQATDSRGKPVWSFPGKPCLPEDFGLTGEETLEEAFQHIISNPWPPQPPDGRGPCGGQCGSGAGNPLPDEPGKDEPKPQDEDQQEQDGEQQDQQQASPDQGRSELDMERMARAFAEALQDSTTKAIDSIPAGLRQFALDLLKPPTISWDEYLENVASKAVDYRPGAQDWIYGPTSRRQAGIGFGEGKPILPAMIEPTPFVGVVQDTSGSMSGTRTKKALGVLDSLLGRMEAEVSYVACDCAAGTVGQLGCIEHVVELMQGGGGTDMRVGIDALLDQQDPPEVIFVVTDAEIPHPGKEPDVPVVWISVGDDQDWEAPWGTTVVVGKEYPA